MKKFIAFLFLIVITAVTINSVKSQTFTLNKWAEGQSYEQVTNDYTLTNTTARTFVFQPNFHQKATQDYIVNLDSLSGNHTNVAVAFYGQKSTVLNDWTQIGSTVNWLGTTADTTFAISNATANRYRLYKVVITGTGTGTTRVDNQELKLWRE